MNYGIITDEAADVYHATDCVSAHRLNDFAAPNVPLLYYRKYIARSIPPSAPSTAMAFGAYFHALALEGETVADSRYIIAPKFDRRTKQGKLDAEDFEIKNAGKKSITQEDRDLAWRMVDSIRAQPAIVEMLKQGRPEVTFRKKMSSFSIQSRLDWYDERKDEFDRPLILDVKTIGTLADFDSHFLKFNYWRQAAFYQMVVYETLGLTGPWPRFKFLVVEKEEPFQCKIRTPDELALEIGRKAVMRDLTRLKICYDESRWPGESGDEQIVELPEWFVKRFPA